MAPRTGEMALPGLFSTEVWELPGWGSRYWQDCSLCSTPQSEQKKANGTAGRDMSSRQWFFSVVTNFREIKTKAQTRFSIEAMNCRPWGVFKGILENSYTPRKSRATGLSLSCHKYCPEPLQFSFQSCCCMNPQPCDLWLPSHHKVAA